jgi:hypothetical protein
MTPGKLAWQTTKKDDLTKMVEQYITYDDRMGMIVFGDANGGMNQGLPSRIENLDGVRSHVKSLLQRVYSQGQSDGAASARAEFKKHFDAIADGLGYEPKIEDADDHDWD